MTYIMYQIIDRQVNDQMGPCCVQVYGFNTFEQYNQPVSFFLNILGPLLKEMRVNMVNTSSKKNYTGPKLYMFSGVCLLALICSYCPEISDRRILGLLSPSLPLFLLFCTSIFSLTKLEREREREREREIILQFFMDNAANS